MKQKFLKDFFLKLLITKLNKLNNFYLQMTVSNYWLAFNKNNDKNIIIARVRINDKNFDKTVIITNNKLFFYVMYKILSSFPNYYPRVIKRFGYSIHDIYNEYISDEKCTYSYKPIFNLLGYALQINHELFDDDLSEININRYIINLIEFFQSRDKYSYLLNKSNKIKAF